MSIFWVLALGLALPLAAQVNVLTYQYGNTRAGTNSNETDLAPSGVNADEFGKLFSQPVDGEVYGQPLYLANVAIGGMGVHNVVYVVTEHDSVYAFDADGNADTAAGPLWQDSFIDPANGVTTVAASDVGCDQITPEIGITSTPVIDPASGTLYVVAMTKESGVYFHRLHALDAASGAERPGSPVAIAATYPGTGEGGSTVVFRAENYKQRPGLLLLNGVVYTAWSSHCDLGLYHGWLIGYDAQSLRQVAVYNNTPDGNEGSFWASGAAPAADSGGNIYLVAGNGTFDSASGGPDLGESYIKLSTTGGLSVADYFTPFNYADLNDNDVDVGSGGVALLGDEAGSSAHPHLMAGAGKEGRVYLLDRDNMGRYQAGSDSQIVQSLLGAVSPVFGNPAYFNGTVYFCGVGDTLKAFPMANGMLPASAASQSPERFIYPGCVPSISADGTSNGIVWVLEGSGTLHAYDAGNLANELYNSNQNAVRDALGTYVKFTVPTIANGKVYAGTANSLAVYGHLRRGLHRPRP